MKSPYRKGNNIELALSCGLANIHKYFNDPVYYFDCVGVQEQFLTIEQAKNYMHSGKKWKSILIQDA